MDWFIECEKAVSALDQICRLKLDKLWDPPVAEEDFIKYTPFNKNTFFLHILFIMII